MLSKCYVKDLLAKHTKILVSSKLSILSSILSLPKEKILTYEKELSHRHIQLFESKCLDLLSGVPIEYLINHSSFYFLDLYINEDVLIPRPETENLVDIILNSGIKPVNVVEIGTGSGAISIALSKNLPKDLNTKFLSIDISEKALKIAKLNAKKNLVDNITFKEVDIKYLKTNETFDLIVSNPPYINSKQIRYLEKSVKHHEPHIALDGGIDGLGIVRDILNFSKTHLSKDGEIYLEINSKRQYESIKKEFKSTFKTIKLLKDQYGRYRYVYLS
jgi:release factor glutamine methyltransferase